MKEDLLRFKPNQVENSDVRCIYENKKIVIALNTCGANVGFVEINSDKGHDSFLLDVPEFLKTVREFLNSTYNEIKK